MASMQPGPNVASWPPSAKSKPPRRTPCAPNSASRTRAKLDFGATSNARRHPQQHRAGAALHSTAGAGLADARAAGVRVRARLCMSDSLFLRIKSLNIRTMRGVSSSKSVVRVAAAHNLRELAAELGVNATSGIDPSRIGLNYQLRGPDTAAGVADLAQALLDNAGVTKLRRDACMALELVFSLPQGSAVNHREYFAAAVDWADDFFNVPILSAAVHLDEPSRHMHVLLLPLVAGRMQGGALSGGPAKIKMMLADFQKQVGQRFGLVHQPRAKRLSKTNRDAGGRLVLDALKAHPERLNVPAVRDALVAALGQHHETLLPLLGLALPTPAKARGKSFAAIMTAPCRLERTASKHTSIHVAKPKSIHIGPTSIENELPESSNVYHCVHVAPTKPAFPHDFHHRHAIGDASIDQPNTEGDQSEASQPEAGAQWSAAQRSTSGITSATGQIRNTSSAQVQTVSLAQPLKPAVEIAPTSSVPADQRQPADTLLEVQEAPAPPTTGPTANTGNEPTKRARAAANRQPASTPAPGERAEMDNLVLAQQPTSASTAPMATVKDVQPLDAPETKRMNFVQLVEQHTAGAAVDATTFGRIPSFVDTPAADVDRVLRTEQVPTATALQPPIDEVQILHPIGGAELDAEGDYQRQHDDDHLAECWDEHGEFVTVPSTRARPPRSRPALQSNASSNAPSMPRALPEARASPTALAHQLLAIASATSTNERPKP